MKELSDQDSENTQSDGYHTKAKTRHLDRWLDAVVKFSGSEIVFFGVMAALLIWAFLGIKFGKLENWQVVISDVQAILTYVFDSFLMRQQLNSYGSLLEVTACLRSRDASTKRMLKRLMIDAAPAEKVVLTKVEERNISESANELPSENWLGRVSTRASNVIGHIVTVGLFWVGIFIWIGFGHYCGWSNQWQLYINSATSALMVFIFAFLANIRECHNQYTERCLDVIYRADSTLEHNLRLRTDDSIPNQPIVIPAPKTSKIQRAIDYYADVVGTLAGIALLLIVVTVWVAVGPLLSWSANWWLFIGTYAGLVGMNDGFVLRNIDFQLRRHEDEQLELVRLDDLELFEAINEPQLPDDEAVDTSLACQISVWMGTICSHRYTVVVGAASVIGLIIGSSAMHWSLTGQLLSNIPPSIVESFFMMILITSHNIADARRRVILHDVYLRRLKLISYVNQQMKG